MKKSQKGFTIIELLVWVFIFSMGLLSIYFTIHQSIKLNDMSRNNIIATNLAREWVELVKNTRDSNYANVHVWNAKNPLQGGEITDDDKFGKTEKHYKVYNDFTENSSNKYSVKFEEISDFTEWEDKLAEMEKYRLYLDSQNRYIYNNGSTLIKKTPYFRYVKIEPAKYDKEWTEINLDWVIITSKVIWSQRGYHETEIKSVLTNWIRQ